jgi:molybdopterin-containing oxidoreductase family iron-sulfur binding subunit
MQPACIEVCPGRARFFGDFNDPDSEVSQLISEGNVLQLLPEKGTNPSIYYLV